MRNGAEISINHQSTADWNVDLRNRKIGMATERWRLTGGPLRREALWEAHADGFSETRLSDRAHGRRSVSRDTACPISPEDIDLKRPALRPRIR